MKTVTVTIQGVSPLLINRFKEQDEIPAKITKGKKDYGTPREQAEKTAYVDEKSGKLFIPTTWVCGAIKTIASDYKIAGRRKSLKSVTGGAIIPVEEKMFFAENYTIKDIEVDSRPVVIQGRDRIMRHRSRLEKWTLTCSLEVDEEIIPVDQVHSVISDAGKRAGLGDFRPAKTGPFGRFQIVKWEVLEEKVKKAA